MPYEHRHCPALVVVAAAAVRYRADRRRAWGEGDDGGDVEDDEHVEEAHEGEQHEDRAAAAAAGSLGSLGVLGCDRGGKGRCSGG